MSTDPKTADYRLAQRWIEEADGWTGVSDPEEFGAQLDADRASLVELIQKVRTEERDACAKLADEYGPVADRYATPAETAAELAKRIRARGPAPAHGTMSTPDALEWAWARKAKHQDHFLHAELKEEQTFNPAAQGGKPSYKRPAGTKVLVTVVSAMGDVCLRCTDVDSLCHGYDLRLPPDALTNYRPAVAWKKEGSDG